jgi:hypothetical protein
MYEVYLSNMEMKTWCAELSNQFCEARAMKSADEKSMHVEGHMLTCPYSSVMTGVASAALTSSVGELR